MMPAIMLLILTRQSLVHKIIIVDLEAFWDENFILTVRSEYKICMIL